ncbi:unnamed protein product, partial [Scytosiphon promiscuus]
CLIPPIKTPTTEKQALWSGRLESVRKDVECFFGYLKGRFRILKLSILYRNEADIHNVFFTCCILHNMLHAYDGLDELEPETNGAGADGRHEILDRNPLADYSSVGQRPAGASSETTIEVETEHAALKAKLIEH